MKQKCPLCNGTGKYLRKKNQRRNEILELRKKGLTYHEIMKVTGLKSTSTVWFHLWRGNAPVKTYLKHF